jgi:hypothetical protein
MGRVQCHLSGKTWLRLAGGVVKTCFWGAFLRVLAINMSFSYYCKGFFYLLECLQKCGVKNGTVISGKSTVHVFSQLQSVGRYLQFQEQVNIRL